MTTGIKSTSDCVDCFNVLKLRKSCRYIVYRIYNEQQIKVEKQAPRECTYQDLEDDLIDAMNKGEGRYVVYDRDDPNINSLVFILWNPSNSTTRNRMLYAGSKDALFTKLVGIKKTIEATEIDDLDVLKSSTS